MESFWQFGNLKQLSCTRSCAIFLYLFNYNFSLGVAHYHSVTIPHNLWKTTLFLNTKCDNRHNENYHHNHNYSHNNNYGHNHPMFKEVWQRVDCAGQQNASFEYQWAIAAISISRLVCCWNWRRWRRCCFCCCCYQALCLLDVLRPFSTLCLECI